MGLSATKPQVIFAEDNEDHAFFIERSLSSLGAELRRVCDGEEALRCLENWQGELPKLVLLDINMPRLSGLEVLEKVRENQRLQYVPVVILSTSNLPADRERAYAAHANSYVTKPSSFTEFRDVLNRIGRYWTQMNLTNN